MSPPPRTRLKSNSDTLGADSGTTRKRKYEPDVSALLNEIEALKSVCNNTFKAVDELKVLTQSLLDENVSIKAEICVLKSLYASSTVASDISHGNIVDKLEELKTSSVSGHTSSFSSVVKSNPVVVIRPKNVKQTNDTTKKDLRENMSPTASKVCGVRNVANGGVIVECESEAGSDVFMKDATVKLGENYIVSIPTKRSPKIRIIGMSEQFSSSTLIEKMVAQNKEYFCNDYSAEVVSTFKIKNRFGAKIIVDPSSFAKIMTNAKLRLGWDICRVYEDLDLTRCYNCSGYHHLAKNCTSKKQCPKCAGEHTMLECISTVESCCNCLEAASSLNLAIDAKHSALSPDCPVYERKINAQRRRTNYNK